MLPWGNLIIYMRYITCPILGSQLLLGLGIPIWGTPGLVLIGKILTRSGQEEERGGGPNNKTDKK